LTVLLRDVDVFLVL